MRKFLLFLLCVIINNSAVPAYALDVSGTPANEFLPAAPIMVTAYQTADAAQSLMAVEVYNDGDVPLDPTKWALYALLKDGSSRAVATSTDYDGWFLPGEHLVYSTGDATTYGLSLGRQASAIISLELRYTGTDQAYKPAAAPIKDQTDQPFFRIYTSTGYSTAAQPFATAPARVFYDDGLYRAPASISGLQIVEVYPYSSDCAPNDVSVLCGDYVKLANTSSEDVVLDGLVLRTDSSSAGSTSSNTFTLAGTLKSGEYLAVFKTDSGSRISLTNSGGYLWLEDAWGLARYDNTMAKYESASANEQGYAYALAADGAWAWTTTPQPAGANIITEPVAVIAECPEGKYRNPDTGRCRTIEEAVNALAACEEGYERNPVTNRCRRMVTTAVATLTPCLEGQERNPATNRCRSIASAVAELMPCDEGYERNPASNRCRKVAGGDVPAAEFPVEPLKAAASDVAGWWAFGAVLAVALGYGAWEWRAEIASFARRALGILARNK